MEKIFCFVRDFLPDWPGTVVGSIGSAVGICVTHLYGGWSMNIEYLVIAMIIDYISGVAASFFSSELYLDSRVGFKGIVKKVLVLMMVAMGHIVDGVIGTELVMPMVLWFYMANECLSITENVANAGVPIPRRLRATLRQVSEGKVRK